MKLNAFFVQLFGSDRSKEDFQQLSTWKKEGEVNAQQIQEMLLINAQTAELKDYKAFDVDAALSATMSQIDIPSDNSKSWKYWMTLSVAILALAIAYLLYQSFSPSTYTPKTYIANSEIIKESLLDGSKIVLNHATSLTYDKVENEMYLNGQAGFEITKQNKPLTIETKAGKITVLGTSFNVISTEELTEIYMYSGTINFVANSGMSYTLKGGEGIICDSDGINTFTSDNRNVYNYWQNGQLVYKNTDLTNVLEDLERLYKKDFSAYKAKAKGLMITANFTDNSLDEILAELAVITGLKF